MARRSPTSTSAMENALRPQVSFWWAQRLASSDRGPREPQIIPVYTETLVKFSEGAALRGVSARTAGVLPATGVLPNFFLVGAPKAGTTSLYFYLRQHPQIYMSPIKEPHFFCDEMRLENFTEELWEMADSK